MAITKKSAAPKKATISAAEDNASHFAEPIRRMSGEAAINLVQPLDAKSEFIAELAASIAKWRSRPGKEAEAYAKAYENVMYGLLSPEE